MIIRVFDILFSFLGIVMLSPFLIIVGFWVGLDSKGPILFVQKRVGKGNVDFKLFKFRTMKVQIKPSRLITVGDDLRITRSGHFLRKLKLDELPQLFNVLIGDMSLVGPRPEVRKYVETYDKSQLSVLNIRPGITDYSSLTFRNESDILGTKSNPEEYYVNRMLPQKLELSMKYVENPNIKDYFHLIFSTVFVLFKGNTEQTIDKEN